MQLTSHTDSVPRIRKRSFELGSVAGSSFGNNRRTRRVQYSDPWPAYARSTIGAIVLEVDLQEQPAWGGLLVEFVHLNHSPEFAGYESLDQNLCLGILGRGTIWSRIMEASMDTSYHDQGYSATFIEAEYGAFLDIRRKGEIIANIGVGFFEGGEE